MTDRRQNAREVRPPVGTELTATSWLTEAPLRMLMNNLHPDVAENPDELVVYGGIGRAARDWNSFDKIVESLTEFGIEIARRTVAKYRESLNIPSSVQRRRQIRASA